LQAALEAVLAALVSGTLPWADIEALLAACGAGVIEGRGLRVRFEKDSEIEILHRPHPEREAKRYQAPGGRAFQTRLGIEP